MLYSNSEYSCWRLYQYNEEDYLLIFFIPDKRLSNYNLQINKEKMLIDNFSLFTCSLFMCLLLEIKIEIESRLHSIDKHDDDCSTLKSFV